MIDIFPSFESSLKTATSSAAVSFVLMRSSVYSAFPFMDPSDRRIRSYGCCLDRFMEGKIRGKLGRDN
jgi:hypothetical protein